MCRRTPITNFTVDLLIACLSMTLGDYVQRGYGGGSSAAQIKFNIIHSNTGRRIRRCDLFHIFIFIFLLFFIFLLIHFFSFRFVFVQTNLLKN